MKLPTISKIGVIKPMGCGCGCSGGAGAGAGSKVIA